MKRIKKILSTFLAVCLGLSFTGCKNNSYYEKDEKLYGKHNAVITVKNYGEIKIELDGDIAPVTVANFVRLINEGFYDGLTFHRAIDGFMLQGGDPQGTGFGNSDKRIYGEFTKNGFQNDLLHTRGVISMARSNNPNSASCQFFIMHGAADHLDGLYAAFGKVTSGMEVVDNIMKDLAPIAGDNGEIASEKQPIIEKIEMVE